jgi:hypothetical protein
VAIGIRSNGQFLGLVRRELLGAGPGLPADNAEIRQVI